MPAEDLIRHRSSSGPRSLRSQKTSRRRPRANRGRHGRWLRPAALTVSLGLTSALGWAVGEWTPRPRLDLPGLRLAADRAAALVAPGDTAETGAQEARRLGELRASAERATEEAGRAPWWSLAARDPGPAWDRVTAASFEAVRREAWRRSSDRQRWVTFEAELRGDLERAAEQLATPGVGRSAATQVERAAVGLEAARRLAAAGAFGQALAEGEAVQRRLAEVDAAWSRIQERFGRSELRRRWKVWVEETVAATRGGGTAVVVDKLGRRLSVYQRGRRVADFAVELGVRGLSPKLHAGDRATPEGRYRVVEVKSGGRTRYHKALLLDYPNREDLERFRDGRRRGTIPDGVGVGGLIEIHGEGGRGNDWTDGCVALSNEDMDRLFRLVGVGTPVTIVGTLGGDAKQSQEGAETR